MRTTTTPQALNKQTAQEKPQEKLQRAVQDLLEIWKLWFINLVTCPNSVTRLRAKCRTHSNKAVWKF